MADRVDARWDRQGAAGPLRFARYAYPPNLLGYCGPDDPATLLEYTTAGVSDPGLAQLARGFDGAWPYLELIAGANGIADPLDGRVVEAYWVGNGLLDRVEPRRFARALADRFSPRVGRSVEDLLGPALSGLGPQHGFHVFAVYPWVGLLRGPAGAMEPLRVLDACRIRWGRVVDVCGGDTLVRSRPLDWDGRRLSLGPARVEQAVAAVDGGALAHVVEPGDLVALHWGWVCERLSPTRAATLARLTARQLAVVNGATRPGPVAVLS